MKNIKETLIKVCILPNVPHSFQCHSIYTTRTSSRQTHLFANNAKSLNTRRSDSILPRVPSVKTNTPNILSFLCRHRSLIIILPT
ncbi:hypothetical protein L1887_29285 [Cichorium endivia]|nr:hypothetical protein L1887_29285 [Cichorium endivia]